MRRTLLLLGLCAACGGNGYDKAGRPQLPEPDQTFNVFPPGATAEELAPAIDEGLKTPGHGVRQWHFIVIRAGDRHGSSYRKEAFAVVVGAGVRLVEGALLIRRSWSNAGQIDGNNEQPQRYGIAIAVESGAPRPFSEAVRRATVTVCQALTRRLPIHPDCVLAMGEIAYTNPHGADLDEKALAAVARKDLPAPPVDGRLVISSGGREIAVDFERRDTTEGIEVGMMFRRGFDGPNRGMLFTYANATYRNFWMKNCRMPIDLAYIHDGKIQQTLTMEPGFGKEQRLLPRYESTTVVKRALEMPAGWFEKNGVEVGDKVEFR